MEIYIKDERGEKHMVNAVHVFKDVAPVHIKEVRRCTTPRPSTRGCAGFLWRCAHEP